jgi:endonuclease YncB( thermonuclease family)
VKAKINRLSITLKIVGLCILAVLLSVSATYDCEFKAIRIYDGDTVKAAGHGIEIKVRPMAIDAPETSRNKGGAGQPFSQRSTKHLAGMALKKVVHIQGLSHRPLYSGSGRVDRG